MAWSGFILNKNAWATGTVSGPSAASTTRPTYWVETPDSCGGIRVRIIGQGADNATSGAITLFAVQSHGAGGDDSSGRNLYTATPWYTIVSSATLSGASIADHQHIIGQSGVVRFADTFTGGSSTGGLVVSMDAALGNDTTDLSEYKPTDYPGELVFGNWKGIDGIAFSCSLSDWTALNIMVNYER